MPTFVNKNFVTPTVTKRRTVNGDSIKIFGRMPLSISIPSLRRTFPFTFFLADVKDNILGLDFLNEFKITINCDNLFLTDNITGLSTRHSLPPVEDSHLSVRTKTFRQLKMIEGQSWKNVLMFLVTLILMPKQNIPHN